MPGGVHAAEADVRGMASCHAGGRASVKPLINRTAGQNVNDGRRCLGVPGRDGVTGVGECRPCRSPALTPGRRHGRRRPAATTCPRGCGLTSATVTWPRRGPRPDATDLCHGSAVSLAGWHVRVTDSGARIRHIDMRGCSLRVAARLPSRRRLPVSLSYRWCGSAPPPRRASPERQTPGRAVDRVGNGRIRAGGRRRAGQQDGSL